MDYPTFQEIQQLRDVEIHRPDDKRRPLLPLYRDILADMDTPVSAYSKTAQQPYSFLLESVSGGEHVKRYSFIGIDPYLVLIQRDDTATLLRMHYERNETSPQTTREDVPCFDPLKLVEEDSHIIGASPELLVRYEDQEVTIHPIAGTRPRGQDKQSDEQLAAELQQDVKERAEHIMLLDLARNDVGRVSKVGSIIERLLLFPSSFTHTSIGSTYGLLSCCQERYGLTTFRSHA